MIFFLCKKINEQKQETFGIRILPISISTIVLKVIGSVRNSKLPAGDQLEYYQSKAQSKTNLFDRDKPPIQSTFLLLNGEIPPRSDKTATTATSMLIHLAEAELLPASRL